MSRSFDITMAGLISGLVALATTFLGLGGTVLGAVLGAIIYQILSIFIKEPLENSNLRKLENGIVFCLPLILIAIILLVFILAYVDTVFFDYYSILKEFTNNNLLRLMGVGLIFMGLYPLIQSKNISKTDGGMLLFLGLIIFFRGLIDINYNLYNTYTVIFGEYDLLIHVSVFLVLIFIIFKIFFKSIKLYRLKSEKPVLNKDNNNSEDEKYHEYTKVKSSKTNTISKNKEIINNISFNKSDSQHKKEDESFKNDENNFKNK